MPAAPALRAPELMLDFALPAGRERFSLQEVAALISVDDGKAPVSVQSIRNGLECGALTGSRYYLTAEKERSRLQHMLRRDVLMMLVRARTSPPDVELSRLCAICATLGPEALDALLAHLTTLRARQRLAR